MRGLIIGLGSMGSRRVRNLKHLGVEELAGVDIRQDRRLEAKRQFGIEVFEDTRKAVTEFEPDFLVISTSPESHMEFAFLALEHGLDAFIEASVTDRQRIEKLAMATAVMGPMILPSTTMRYYPGPTKLKEIIDSEILGKLLHFTYTTGQRLEDWHPWERISDYYVSRRETGGAREIVPFELTWLTELFGIPEILNSRVAKLSEVSADIDDYYQFAARFPNGLLGNVTIDVISGPKASREFRLFGSKGLVKYTADTNHIEVAADGESGWDVINLEHGTVEKNYINPEEPYIREMADFLSALRSQNSDLFPNSLANDAAMLGLLDEIEKRGRLD